MPGEGCGPFGVEIRALRRHQARAFGLRIDIRVLDGACTNRHRSVGEFRAERETKRPLMSGGRVDHARHDGIVTWGSQPHITNDIW